MIRFFILVLAVLIASCQPGASGGTGPGHTGTPRAATFSSGQTPNVSWTQATWFIDPQSTFGTCNDQNTGVSSSAPVCTWQAIVTRWGTYSPTLAQSTTFTWQSSQSANGLTDPVQFTPLITPNVTVQMIGTLTQVWTGTLAGVVAKNRATPQLLTATLPAGAAANQIIKNSTLGSTATVFASLGGGNFTLTQPQVDQTIPWTSASGPAEDDTWANTNTVTGFTQPAVNLAYIRPHVMAGTGAPNPRNSFWVSQLSITDPAPTSGPPVWTNGNVTWVDCLFSRVVTIDNDQSSGLFSPTFGEGIKNGTDIFAYQIHMFGANTIGSGTGGIRISGGSTGTVAGGNYAIYNDSILTQSAIATAGAATIQNVYLTSGKRLQTSAEMDVVGIVWGPGGPIDINGKGVLINQTGGTYTSNFLYTSATPYHINGGTTACSIVLATGVVACNITINNTNLDAAAGAAGFGNNAFLPYGGSITNGF